MESIDSIIVKLAYAHLDPTQLLARAHEISQGKWNDVSPMSILADVPTWFQARVNGESPKTRKVMDLQVVSINPYNLHNPYQVVMPNGQKDWVDTNMSLELAEEDVVKKAEEYTSYDQKLTIGEPDQPAVEDNRF